MMRLINGSSIMGSWPCLCLCLCPWPCFFFFGCCIFTQRVNIAWMMITVDDADDSPSVQYHMYSKTGDGISSTAQHPVN
ncbi:hypothetical protein V8C35DRAFT_314365 [Trichoderma chlorosporum]